MLKDALTVLESALSVGSELTEVLCVDVELGRAHRQVRRGTKHLADALSATRC